MWAKGSSRGATTPSPAVSAVPASRRYVVRTAPDSLLAVEVIARTGGAGVLWCDGRRAVDLPPGARIEVRRADQPVRLARLHQAPFTDRLVAKFDLPVHGWRGAAERLRRERGDA